MPKFFGTPVDVKVGDLFENRQEMHDRNLHAPTQPGISGNEREGADSIVLSGGYVGDEDHGDYLIYTGEGGKATNSKRQIADQSTASPGNAGLISSWARGFPVRVTRGARHKSPYSPPVGYQYAGLYLVVDWWIGVDAESGFKLVQFRLERDENQPRLTTSTPPEDEVAYAKTIVTRRVRDSPLSREIKSLYDYSCQLCGASIPSAIGKGYSEGAHVRPLGRPHLGADAATNLLSLCPNHHTQLDLGGMFILSDFVVVDRELTSLGELSFERKHVLEPSNAAYHRDHWSFSPIALTG